MSGPGKPERLLRRPGPWAAFPADNYMTCHVDIYVMYHVCCRGDGDRPAAAGHVTTGQREPGHDKAQPRSGAAEDRCRPRRRGQATRSAGLVTPARSGTVLHRVVAAHLACRIGARARAGKAPAPPPGTTDGAGKNAQRTR